MYRTRKSGFTLVEILIVVIILGILAAIVIPQFTNASQDARKSNLASQCQTLKSQIELFKLQHHDTAPLLITSSPQWQQFLFTTNDTGTVSSPNSTTPDQATGFTYGPYMQSAPSNPLVDSANGTKVAAIGTVDGTAGWTYDETTGKIHGVAKGTDGNFYETDDGVTKVSDGSNIP